MMENITIILIIILIIGSIIWYLLRQKKKGVKCIGCPYAGQCSGKCDEKKV